MLFRSMKMTQQLLLLINPVNLRRACDIRRACKPTCESPISPSISALGVSAATESMTIRSTEKLLRQAMDDYESKKFIAKSENITIGELLDIWAEEELKTGTLSNGTVQNYLGAITNIKKHPISERKLKNVTSEHLQAFFDLLSFGGTCLLYTSIRCAVKFINDVIFVFQVDLQQIRYILLVIYNQYLFRHIFNAFAQISN